MAHPGGMPARVRAKGSKRVENPGKTFKRLMKYILKNYGIAYAAVLVLIFISVLANVRGTLFTKTLIDDYITPLLAAENPDFHPLAVAIGKVAGFYLIGIWASYTYNRIMINVTQGTLRNLRDDIFSHMEKLPIKYFDTHAHGDIMSIYTNDTDTLRQMISQSMVQIFNSGITIVSVLFSMIILNIPLTILTLVMVAVMMFTTKNLASRSGK